MIRCTTCRWRRAFTLIELLVVMAIIGILAAMLLLAVAKAPGRVRRVVCTSNLRQQGVAFHTFAHDHRDRFPQSVPIAEGGALEHNLRSVAIGRTLVVNPQAYRVLSNELGSVRILVCPSSRQLRAVDFPRLGFSNLSYFTAIDASIAVPQSVLAGDNNLVPSTNRPSALRLPAATSVEFQWTPDRHTTGGNVLTSDGAVQFQRGISVAPVLRGGISPASAVRPAAVPAPAPPPTRIEPPSVAPTAGSGAPGRTAMAPTPRIAAPVVDAMPGREAPAAAPTNSSRSSAAAEPAPAEVPPIPELPLPGPMSVRSSRREWPWWLLLLVLLALIARFLWRGIKEERRARS